MLPAPISLPKRRQFSRENSLASARIHYANLFRSRSRLTNLAVFLLSGLCFISIIVNLYFIGLNNGNITPPVMLSSIIRDPNLENLDHMVMVPGHAIWIGTDANLRTNDDQWTLEPYQMGGNRVQAFFEHIAKGVGLSLKDPRSLLVFSGGQTRASSTITEAQSYLRLAITAGLFNNSTAHPLRATTENYALDSYQNLLFSIARFREYTGRFPSKITIVGYDFKRARFTDLHRAALHWPRSKFHYIGVDPQDHGNHDAEAGELQNGYKPYSRDLYGCHSNLQAKRRQRNVHTRFHPYYTSCPELQALLNWCPSPSDNADEEALFSGSLPWN
ncbi:hypothetical protein BDN72DRAFT_833017 [Pluteus cervinus]|uniref:Uncharacterized protein n=1 Tax=Pluteus cervinus TaxID=181527 RepID=A0ACD3BAD3_9AGAR|nr:hypothetical protein BDN72DRAFT_833017 [Pluteus cervinus]